ncbi:hypothetical protein A5814_002246 [Enterococcus faecium]|nr:hypothetical protein A5814_002246 [Enterococcus faecium]
MGFFIAKILLFLGLVGAAYLVYAILSKQDEKADSNDDEMKF